MPNAAGGVCMHQNILFLEFCYFGLWRTHLPNYTFWGHLRSTGQLFSRKKKFIFWCQLRPKVTFKGVRRREGDMLHWISVLASLRHLVLEYAGLRHLVLGYENAKHSYVYKTIAKKTCAPKTRATLAMPNILLADFWEWIQNVVCSKIFCYCNLKHCLKFMKLCFMLSKVPWATIYWLKCVFFEIFENILQQKWDNPEFFTKFYKLLKHVS